MKLHEASLSPRRLLRWMLAKGGWWSARLAGSLVLAGAVTWVVQGAWIGTGFFAKQLCSAVFVSGRTAQGVVDSDLRLYTPPLLYRYIDWSVDRAAGRVHATWLHGIGREARYRPTQGCTLVYASEHAMAETIVLASNAERAGIEPAPARLQRTAAPSVRSARETGTLPRARGGELQALVDAAFDEPDADRLRGTRAVVVIHDGRIVAERYAQGFDRETRFPGWSLSKSVLNAMIGALAQRGALDVNDPVPLVAWRGDDRSRLTFDHLLRMSSGLKFDENYDSPFSDVTRMLYGVADAGAYAGSRPLVAAPGTVWSYASGSTSVLAHALSAYARPGLAYAEMPRRLVFGPLGMTSALMESDPSGNLEASASVYASARDWARFGWLYANDGVCDGVRVLPAGWIDYSTTPSRADPSGRYGAHFWIYTEADRMRARESTGAALPRDAFYAQGFGGQRITIAPSLRAVVVRLGSSAGEQGFDNTEFAARILEVLSTPERTRHATALPGRRKS